jgi:RNA polymerase sigma-B factor
VNDRTAVLSRFLATRSRADRDAVIAAYRYLCTRGARKFRRPESDPADLEQVAAVGLIKATDTYRSERSTPFEAYAWLMIVGELMHYVRDHERTIRVPRALRSLERRYVAAWEAIAARQQAEPTTTQLAAALDVDRSVIAEVRAMRRGNRVAEPSSGAARARGACETLPARTGGLSIEERLTVLIAIEALDPRERTIVMGIFGAGLSQAEIATIVGLSQSQVSKILGRALGKLHERVA